MKMVRSLFLAAVSLSASPLLAKVARVAEQPPSEFADTEVVTNVAIAVRDAERTHVEASIALAASPSNSVEVSFGVDADGDGKLCFDEIDWTLGYRCGAWFCRDARTDDFVEWPELQGDGRVRRSVRLRRHEVNPAWNVARVVRRGVVSVSESVVVDAQGPTLMLIVR